MRISARNVLRGRVKAVQRGAVNSEVSLVLLPGQPLTAIITNVSAEKLGLQPDTPVYAIIKASFVMIGKDLEGAKLSARNILFGTISRLVEGPLDTEVHLSLGEGTELVAIITKASAQHLDLKEGDSAFAVIKASSVILGVE